MRLSELVSVGLDGELNGWSADRAKRKAGEIYDTQLQLFELSKKEGLPTYKAADRLAERRIEQVHAIQKTWI